MYSDNELEHLIQRRRKTQKKETTTTELTLAHPIIFAPRWRCHLHSTFIYIVFLCSTITGTYERYVPNRFLVLKMDASPRKTQYVAALFPIWHHHHHHHHDSRRPSAWTALEHKIFSDDICALRNKFNSKFTFDSNIHDIKVSNMTEANKMFFPTDNRHELRPTTINTKFRITIIVVAAYQITHNHPQYLAII